MKQIALASLSSDLFSIETCILLQLEIVLHLQSCYLITLIGSAVIAMPQKREPLAPNRTHKACCFEIRDQSNRVQGEKLDGHVVQLESDRADNRNELLDRSPWPPPLGSFFKRSWWQSLANL